MNTLHAGLMCTALLTGTIAGLFGCMSAVRRHRRFAGFCSAGGIAFPPAGKRDPFPGSMDGSRIVPDGAQPFCVIYAVA